MASTQDRERPGRAGQTAPFTNGANGSHVDGIETINQHSGSLLQEKGVNRICCIGAGYVGGTTSAVIASKCPHITIEVVDLNQARIDAWKSNNLPIYEPGLYEHVTLARDGNHGERRPNLFFSTNIDSAIASADLIFLAVNTPTKRAGRGAGAALDIGYLESAVRKIATVSTSDKIIVEKSTTPCRTAEFIQEVLYANTKHNIHFHVLSNPEFLAEGTAISDLLHPNRILIGSLRGESDQIAANALASIYTEWVPSERIIKTNLWSSELAKMAANAFLAQRISSINAISSICERTGAEVTEVSRAIGLDERVGKHMLNASVGFGGSCFRKDVLGLAYLAESLHLPEVAAYWNQVVEINEWQKARFARRVTKSMYNTLTNKKVAVLGFAYKKNTGDTRESPAISVVNQLIAERAQVSIYDPIVKREAIYDELYATNSSNENIDEHVEVEKDVYTAAKDANAIVVLTAWDEFVTTTPSGTESRKGKIDWKMVATLMVKPAFVFDGCNVLDHLLLGELGFNVECVGKQLSNNG